MLDIYLLFEGINCYHLYVDVVREYDKLCMTLDSVSVCMLGSPRFYGPPTKLLNWISLNY